MNRFIVAVIDGTKARLLTLEPVQAPEYESGPNLVEQCELLNPARAAATQELWATTKGGRNRSRVSRGHSYSTERNTQLVEFERRFAQSIAEQLNLLVRSHDVHGLVLAAEPQILGLMRECLSGPAARLASTRELAKDLCHLKPHDLHEYLAQKGMLPARQRALSSR